MQLPQPQEAQSGRSPVKAGSLSSAGPKFEVEMVSIINVYVIETNRFQYYV